MERLPIMGALLASLVIAGCSSSDGGHRAPSGVGGCNHMFGLGDAGSGTGLDWDTDQHRYPDVVALYVCMTGAEGGVAVVAAPPHVIVSRTRVEVTAPALVRLTVRVEPGGQGRLQVTFRHRGGDLFGDVRVPEIVASGEGWHFGSD